MSRIVPQAIGLMAALLAMQSTEIEAYCARCAKIEGDRAKEQTENPQPIRYYDDQKSMHGESSNSQPKAAAVRKESGELALSDTRPAVTNGFWLPAAGSKRLSNSGRQSKSYIPC